MGRRLRLFLPTGGITYETYTECSSDELTESSRLTGFKDAPVSLMCLKTKQEKTCHLGGWMNVHCSENAACWEERRSGPAWAGQVRGPGTYVLGMV